MIFTGLKDENGNIIPVQGAGTVYNEEKNSLALGKDTVATGQDQLVLGRMNLADENMAEIVGGGKESSTDITDELIESIETLPVGSILNVKTNTTSWLSELSLRIVTHTFSEFASKFPLEYFNTIMFELMHNADASKVIACCEVVSEIPNVWGATNANEKHDKAAPMLLVRSTTYKLLLVSPTELETVRKSLTTRFSFANGVRFNEIAKGKNIRTLDWNGHEHLAGSLAIGEGSVAGTKGQLVFGRNNVADVNKAEVVGGGSTSESSGSGSAELSIVIGTTPANHRCVLVLEPIANLASEGITWGQITGRYYYKIVSRTAYVEGSDFYVFKNSPLYFIETRVPVEQLVSYENFENPAQDVENGKYFTIMVGEKEDNSLSSAFVYRGVVNAPMLTRKNIRTLDWQGNQWNAGDVTCDDAAHENVLSLRETAAKADGLETALAGKADADHAHSQYLTEHQDISGKADVVHTHDIADVTGLQDALDAKMDDLKEIFIDCDDSNSWEIKPDAAGEAAFANALVWNNTAPRLVLITISKVVDSAIKKYRTIGSIHATSVEVNVDSYDLTAEIYVDGHVFTRTGQELQQEQTWGQGLALSSSDIFAASNS